MNFNSFGVVVRTYPTSCNYAVRAFFKMRFSYHRLLADYSRLAAVRIFQKQGALVDSGENSAEGSGITPSLFFSRMAASAFIQDAFHTSPFGKSSIRNGSFFLGVREEQIHLLQASF